MPPNILLFLTDDHAQWAAGAYGNREIRTPTLDYLAQTGVQMANAFTPTPVCSPARASLLTGLLPSQHGIHDYLSSDDPAISQHDWLADTVTLPALLQNAGYETAMIGKWQLPAPPTTIVDVTGAGNSYCGGFLTGLGDGLSALESALRAAVSASFALEQFGLPAWTTPPYEEAHRRLQWARERVKSFHKFRI